VKKYLTKIHKPIRVAVMGCVVNGPAEAADAMSRSAQRLTKALSIKTAKKSHRK
jgi:4-hydroxy-3-methylbut-2-en-1-yl diphosphate synthase IspG/GcpE